MPNFTTTLAGAAAVFGQQAKLVTDACEKLMKEIIDEVTVEVVNGTPVDTGLARSNWLASIGTPRAGVIPPHVPYPKFSGANGLQINEQANAVIAIADAKAAVAGYKPDDTAYLVNNVDYIGDLNDGINRDPRFHPSTQAPKAFVELAAMKAINTAVSNFTI